MRITKKQIVEACQFLLTAARSLAQHDGMEYAGYLTFLAVLSLFPFLVLLVAVFGLVGQGKAGGDFIAMAITHLPKEAVAALLPRIEEITSGAPHGVLTIAVLGALWTSSSAVEGMRKILNRAYHVVARPHYFFSRILSILQIILFTFLVLGVMSIMVFAPSALQEFSQLTGIAVPLNIMRLFTHYFFYVGAVILFVVVAGVYYILPNIYQPIRAVLPGAALVVGLWVMGAAAVTIYLNKLSSMSLIYGSLSSFIASLIFLYVMNLIFLYGAEFNYVLLAARGELTENQTMPDEISLQPASSGT